MRKSEKIPILQPDEMIGFHFESEWQKSTLSSAKHHFFHINRLEDNIDKMTFPLPPHRKTVHDILFIKEGISRRSKGLDSYAFESSSVFFLPAYQITEHEYLSANVKGYFCHFDEKIFSFLPKNYLADNFFFFQFHTSPIIQLSVETLAIIDVIFERLLKYYAEEKEMDLQLVAAYLLVIFEELKKEMPKQFKKTKNAFEKTTEQYKMALSMHIYQKQLISDYANLLNITPNYLNKCVKNCTNKTAQDLLNEMLILEAKTLLKYSNIQIAEIAVKLCNQTPSNFARFFKKQTGLSPKEFLLLY